MISPQRLLKMARKWRKLTVIGRRRISISRTDRSIESETCAKSVADKGHFFVYTIDGRRFMVPLAYLNSPIFIELFRVSEDQFGLACDGPIRVPCDAVFMEFVVYLIKRRLSKDVEKALLTSIASGHAQHHPCYCKDRTTNKFLVMASREDINCFVGMELAKPYICI